MIPSNIESIMTHILARDVAAGVEMARSLGYVMPANFDIGIKFQQTERGYGDCVPYRVTLRLNDAHYSSLVALPNFDLSVPIKKSEIIMTSAWNRLHADALTLAQVWIDKHPEAYMNDPNKALQRLDAMASDDVVFDRWMSDCRKRAHGLKFEMRKV